MPHPKVSEEKQLITVFMKRSRQSKEYGDLRVRKIHRRLCDSTGTRTQFAKQTVRVPRVHKKTERQVIISAYVLLHPKVSEEKQLITVFMKRSRQSKESGAFRNVNDPIDYATRQVREHSLRSKLFVSHGYTKKIKKHLLSQVLLFWCTLRDSNPGPTD